MKSTGIVRQLDSLGRIVLPVELRRTLNIGTKDQLEILIDGNSVVIVHQKHDGTYEIIPTTYDPVTHTLTFKTSSFSNYAIASTTVATANTLDNIKKYFIIFAVSAAGIVALKGRKEIAKTSK